MPDWIEYRKGVPDESVVNVRATSTGYAAVDVDVVSTGDDDGSMTSQQVEPGPAEWPLMAPEVYLFRARIGFSGPGSAVVEMWVVRPDGSVHSTPAVWEAEGQAGDVMLCNLIVQTV